MTLPQAKASFRDVFGPTSIVGTIFGTLVRFAPIDSKATSQPSRLHRSIASEFSLVWFVTTTVFLTCRLLVDIRILPNGI